MTVSVLVHNIKAAFDYLESQSQDIPSHIWKEAVKKRIFSVKADGDLGSISAEYHDRITTSLTTYFEGGSVVTPRNQFRRAMIEAFGSSFDMGWVDGGQQMPPDAEALNWFNIRVDAELSYIDVLFEQAKELRKEPDFDFFSWVTNRADSYSRTLNGMYNAALLFAKKNQILTWVYGEAEHCQTCIKLNGQKHRASWYINRGYIPRKPGASMDCGGYQCKCQLVDAKGKEVTI
jgi:hypothetical protein